MYLEKQKYVITGIPHKNIYILEIINEWIDVAVYIVALLRQFGSIHWHFIYLILYLKI